jgi:hypothetical protein
VFTDERSVGSEFLLKKREEEVMAKRIRTGIVVVPRFKAKIRNRRYG